jgi:hypothetical protein
MRRRQRTHNIRQLAFPVFYIVWTLLLLLWVMWLVRSH